MDGDNMGWGSLLEESQEADVLGPETIATGNGVNLAFDVDQLWSLFDEETVELN